MEIPAISSPQSVNDHTPKREKREGSLWRRFVSALPKQGSEGGEAQPQDEAKRAPRREGVGDNLDTYA